MTPHVCHLYLPQCNFATRIKDLNRKSNQANDNTADANIAMIVFRRKDTINDKVTCNDSDNDNKCSPNCLIFDNQSEYIYS